jgi:hypothetical protein
MAYSDRSDFWKGATDLGLTIGNLWLPGLKKGIEGRRSKQESEDILDQAGDRPEYEVPGSIDQMISLFAGLSEGGLPGESLMQEQIEAQTARNIGQVSQLADSPSAALAAAQGVQERERDALRDLQVRATQYQDMAKRQYAQAVGSRAPYEETKWDWEQGRRWQEAQNEAWGLRGMGDYYRMAGSDEFGSAVQDIGGMLLGSAMGVPSPDFSGGVGGGGGSPQSMSYMPQNNPYAFTNPPPPMGGYGVNPPSGSFASYAASQNPYGNF